MFFKPKLKEAIFYWIASEKRPGLTDGQEGRTPKSKLTQPHESLCYMYQSKFWTELIIFSPVAPFQRSPSSPSRTNLGAISRPCPPPRSSSSDRARRGPLWAGPRSTTSSPPPTTCSLRCRTWLEDAELCESQSHHLEGFVYPEKYAQHHKWVRGANIKPVNTHTHTHTWPCSCRHNVLHWLKMERAAVNGPELNKVVAASNNLLALLPDLAWRCRTVWISISPPRGFLKFYR